MKLAIFLLFFLQLSCIQSTPEVSITVYNYSSFPIDSILLPQRAYKFGLGLKPGATETIKIALEDDEIKGEGAFDIRFYTNNKMFNGSWGFHDFDQLAKKAETFYVFDNGINFKNNPNFKPNLLTLYIWDQSNPLYDSVKAHKSTIVNYEHKENGGVLVLNFDSLIKYPFLITYKSNLENKLALPIDLSNWNIQDEFLTVKDTLVFKTYNKKIE